MNETLDKKMIETPVGRMQAIASDLGLCALEFIKADRQELLDRRLKRWFKVDEFCSDRNLYLEQIDSWLSAYFARRFDQLATVKLDLRGTPFELKVWQALQDIPLGKTISYSELASRVGIPKAPRAAGGASRRNPVGILIPCHRVIGIRGDLTGYGGGIEQKHFLLNHEGAAVRQSQPRLPLSRTGALEPAIAHL